MIRLGSDDIPATELDIIKVQKLAKKKKKLPKSIKGDYGVLKVSEYSFSTPGTGTLLVEIGTDNRPAGRGDLLEIEKQLRDSVGDKDLTIVTHHGFWAKWLQTANQGRAFLAAKHKPNKY